METYSSPQRRKRNYREFSSYEFDPADRQSRAPSPPYRGMLDGHSNSDAYRRPPNVPPPSKRQRHTTFSPTQYFLGFDGEEEECDFAQPSEESPNILSWRNSLLHFPSSTHNTLNLAAIDTTSIEEQLSRNLPPPLETDDEALEQVVDLDNTYVSSPHDMGGEPPQIHARERALIVIDDSDEDEDQKESEMDELNMGNLHVSPVVTAVVSPVVSHSDDMYDLPIHDEEVLSSGSDFEEEDEDTQADDEREGSEEVIPSEVMQGMQTERRRRRRLLNQVFAMASNDQTTSDTTHTSVIGSSMQNAIVIDDGNDSEVEIAETEKEEDASSESADIEIIDIDISRNSQTSQRKKKIKKQMQQITQWLEDDNHGELVKNVKQHILTCPVCQSHMEKPSCTPCGHLYCWDCIKEVIREASVPTCPMCYRPISMQQIHRVFL